jgi:SAM-dependent methyltransferase
VPFPISFEHARHVTQLAEANCRQAGDDCAWYHGFWPYLRWLGLGCDARRHQEFFLAALREARLDQARLPDVLISGAADESMLALVVDALGPIAATAMDYCQTPLLLCQEFAATRGLSLSIWQGDIRDAPWRASFDIIATHIFLGYFDNQARAEVIKRWFAALKPGGRAITVQRLRPGFLEPTVGFSPEELLGLCRAVENGLACHGTPAALAAEIQAMAKIYGQRFRNFAITSVEQLTEAFTEAGFQLEYCQTEAPPPQTGAGGGPSVADGAIFLKIVARKQS